MGWNPRAICCRTRDFRSRDGACRGLARCRQAPPLALTPGPDHGPGLPALAPSRTSSHATCPIARRFSCRLRSNVPSAWRGVGLLGHPSLAVWHFTLRFVLPGSWVGHPSATAAERRGWAMQSPSGPKVYPKPRSSEGEYSAQRKGTADGLVPGLTGFPSPQTNS